MFCVKEKTFTSLFPINILPVPDLFGVQTLHIHTSAPWTDQSFPSVRERYLPVLPSFPPDSLLCRYSQYGSAPGIPAPVHTSAYQNRYIHSCSSKLRSYFPPLRLYERSLKNSVFLPNHTVLPGIQINSASYIIIVAEILVNTLLLHHYFLFTTPLLHHQAIFLAKLTILFSF